MVAELGEKTMIKNSILTRCSILLILGQPSQIVVIDWKTVKTANEKSRPEVTFILLECPILQAL